MKPIDQDVFGAPDGNCFTACVASLLRIPLDEVRDIEELYRNGSREHYAGDAQAFSKAWAEIQRALAVRFGVTVACFQSPHAPSGYCMAAGKSPRGDFGHYVVVLDGELAHDPHPSRDGLDGPIEDWTVLVPVARRVAA